jgi:hypothetical protein
MQSQAGPAQQEVPPQVASLPEQVASLPESGSNAGLAGAQPSVPIQQPASLPLSSQPGPLSSSHDLEGAGGTLSPLTQGQSEQSRRGQHESASEEEAGTPVASLLAQGQAGGQATSMGLDSVRLNVNTADGGTEDAQETQGYVLAASEAHTALEAAQADGDDIEGEVDDIEGEVDDIEGEVDDIEGEVDKLPSTTPRALEISGDGLSSPEDRRWPEEASMDAADSSQVDQQRAPERMLAATLGTSRQNFPNFKSPAETFGALLSAETSAASAKPSAVPASLNAPLASPASGIPLTRTPPRASRRGVAVAFSHAEAAGPSNQHGGAAERALGGREWGEGRGMEEWKKTPGRVAEEVRRKEQQGRSGREAESKVSGGASSRQRDAKAAKRDKSEGGRARRDKKGSSRDLDGAFRPPK